MRAFDDEDEKMKGYVLPSFCSLVGSDPSSVGICWIDGLVLGREKCAMHLMMIFFVFQTTHSPFSLVVSRFVIVVAFCTKKQQIERARRRGPIARGGNTPFPQPGKLQEFLEEELSTSIIDVERRLVHRRRM